MIDQEGSCGWNLAITYILSPTFEPDRSCIQKILPIDFSGTLTKTKQSALQIFGTDNIWGVKTTDSGRTDVATNMKYNSILFVFIFIIYLT